MGINNSIKNYYDLSKPQIMYLLVFTAIATMIVNKGFSNSIIDLVIIAIAVGFGSAGSSALTGYIDRDIDQIIREKVEILDLYYQDRFVKKSH